MNKVLMEFNTESQIWKKIVWVLLLPVFLFLLACNPLPYAYLPIILDSAGSSIFDNNTSIFIRKGMLMEIKCQLQGSTAKVKKIKLICMEMFENESVTDFSVVVKIDPDHSMHGRHCECVSTLKNNTTELWKVTMDYKGAPELLGEIHVIQLDLKGDSPTMEFDIASNPRPEGILLAMANTVVRKEDYRMNFTRLTETGITYSVKIVMDEYIAKRVANSPQNNIVEISNGVGYLVIRFFGEVVPILTDDSKNSMAWVRKGDSLTKVFYILANPPPKEIVLSIDGIAMMIGDYQVTTSKLTNTDIIYSVNIDIEGSSVSRVENNAHAVEINNGIGDALVIPFYEVNSTQPSMPQPRSFPVSSSHALPVIVINNGSLNESEFTAVGEQDVEIKCYLHGTPKHVEFLFVTCSTKKFKIAKGNLSISMPFHIDKSMHNKTCSCITDLEDGRTEQQTITINYRTDHAKDSGNNQAVSTWIPLVFISIYLLFPSSTDSTS